MKMKRRQDGECLGCDGEFDDIGFRRSHSGGLKSIGQKSSPVFLDFLASIPAPFPQSL